MLPTIRISTNNREREKENREKIERRQIEEREERGKIDSRESEEREELVSALRESQISRPLVLKGYATETLEWDYLTQCMEEIKALVAEKYKRYGVELEEVDPEE